MCTLLLEKIFFPISYLHNDPIWKSYVYLMLYSIQTPYKSLSTGYSTQINRVVENRIKENRYINKFASDIVPKFNTP